MLKLLGNFRPLATPRRIPFLRHMATYDHLSEHIQNVITPEIVDHLYRKGYAVVDNIFPSGLADEARAEVVRLYETEHMHKNCTHFVSSSPDANANTGANTSGIRPPHPAAPPLAGSTPFTSTRLLEKTHIHEAELSLDASIRAAAPLCAMVEADRSLATMLNVFMPPAANLRLDTQAIKLQYNAGGGGCFPIHFDTDERLDGRRVTAIFYLNPGWRPEDGGALRLYPFPSPPIDIAPRHNRAVLFASARMPHRVMPSMKPRCCFTVWMATSPRLSALGGMRRTSPPTPASLSSSSNSASANAPDSHSHPSNPSAAAAAAATSTSSSPSSASSSSPLSRSMPSPDADLDSVARFLLSSAVYPHVCKLAHEAEWFRSLEESHPDTEARRVALMSLRTEAALIRRALAPFLPRVEELRKLGAAAAVPGGEGLCPTPVWYG